MRTKCTYADRYEAKRAPTCGCQTCAKKWDEAQRKVADEAIALAALTVIMSVST